jgi:hypothetical protein
MQITPSLATTVSPISHDAVRVLIGKDNCRKHRHRTRSVKTAAPMIAVGNVPTKKFELPILFCKYELPITENYFYLFCKEINPPPPKAC